MAATAPVGQPGRLAFLVDEATGRRYLVDTGSAYSILPFRSSSKPTGPPLVTAAKSPIRCWGSRRTALRASGRIFRCEVLLADVAFPILGADFLRQHGLMVDLAGLQLVDKAGKAIKLAAPRGGPFAAAIGVVAARGEPGGPSTPSLPTVEALGEASTHGTQEPPAVNAAGVAGHQAARSPA